MCANLALLRRAARSNPGLAELGFLFGPQDFGTAGREIAAALGGGLDELWEPLVEGRAPSVGERGKGEWMQSRTGMEDEIDSERRSLKERAHLRSPDKHKRRRKKLKYRPR